MAGGMGTRLMPLTETRSKPSVPLGGKFRLIDIPLSNAYHSDFRKVLVLTQGKDKSVARHLKNAWVSDEKSESFINILTPQEIGHPYRGDADAVRQAVEDIRYHHPEFVLVVPGDHLLKMDLRNFMHFLRDNRGDGLISIIPQPLSKAGSFGSLALNGESLITEFREKDPDTPLRASTPDTFYASMGIYGFRAEFLYEALRLPGDLFGQDLIPQLLSGSRILGYDYHRHNNISEIIISRREGRMYEEAVDSSPDSHYWRDVGTIGEYFDANMDLVSVTPKFNLYGREWPFFTGQNNLGPAKIINPISQGRVDSAIVSEGSFLSDVQGKELVISPLVFIERSVLEQVIVFGDSKIENCRIRRTIVDKHVHLRNREIGFDQEADLRQGIHVDPETGIRVVPKGYSGVDG